MKASTRGRLAQHHLTLPQVVETCMYAGGAPTAGLMIAYWASYSH